MKEAMLNPVFWLKTSLKFLLRSGRSTFVLSLMVLSSVATLVFLSSMAVGVNDAMVRNSVSLYSGHITGSNLPAGFNADTLKTYGVRAVLTRSYLPGVLSKDGRMEPLTIVGVDPEAELKHTALWKKTVEGGYIEGGDTVYLSAHVAEGLGVKPGDAVRFTHGDKGWIELKVFGIFKTGVDRLDRGTAFVPAQTLLNKGRQREAAIFLEDGEAPSAAIEGYKAKGIELDLKAWDELMPDLRELIELNYVSMTIVMVIVFAVVAIGITSAFSIFILKHMREYGIMKSMGVTSGEMIFFIISEVILMDLAASVLGVATGAVASLIAGGTGIDLGAFTSHNKYFSVSGMIYPRLTFYSVVWPFLLSLLFGALASVWPALLVARRKAADILRMV